VKQLRIVWGALVGGVLLYTMLVYGLMTTGVLDVAALPRSVMSVVGAAVLVYMAAGVLVRRALVARIDPALDRERRVAAYTSATIVGLALTESGGLIVITLGLLSGSSSWVLAGGLAAVALMLGARPDEQDLGD
jgi:hypothetical protein